MRLYSNPESVDKGEPSILAIVETLLAIGLSIWLAIYLGTVKWIAISCCVAPLLLLRTERSTQLGVRTYDELRIVYGRWEELLDKVEMGRVLALELFPVLTIVFSLWSRLYAVLFTLVKHPLVTVTQIPSNWKRVALCLDFACAPEIVGGYEQMGSGPQFKLSSAVEMLVEPSRKAWNVGKKRQRIFEWTLVLIFVALWCLYSLVRISLIFGTPIIYRWSLKATSLIYLPLIWVAWTATRKFESLSRELKNLYKGEMAQLTLIVSGVVVLTFTLKFFGMIVLLEMHDWWTTTDLGEFWTRWTSGTEMGRLADRLVVPDRIPVWHIASFVNAIMAFSLAAFARRLFEYNWNVRGSTIYRVLRVNGVTRVCLSCYTIGCSLWISLSTVEAFKLPRIGEWLPFS